MSLVLLVLIQSGFVPCREAKLFCKSSQKRQHEAHLRFNEGGTTQTNGRTGTSSSSTRGGGVIPRNAFGVANDRTQSPRNRDGTS